MLQILVHGRYLAFVKAFAKARDEVGKEKNLWILKPSGSSQGRGIQVLYSMVAYSFGHFCLKGKRSGLAICIAQVLNDISGVSYGQTVVLQRYIPNPLLLAGYKFDLRLFVTLLSFTLLRAKCFIWPTS